MNLILKKTIIHERHEKIFFKNVFKILTASGGVAAKPSGTGKASTRGRREQRTRIMLPAVKVEMSKA